MFTIHVLNHYTQILKQWPLNFRILTNLKYANKVRQHLSFHETPKYLQSVTIIKTTSKKQHQLKKKEWNLYHRFILKNLRILSITISHNLHNRLQQIHHKLLQEIACISASRFSQAKEDAHTNWCMLPCYSGPQLWFSAVRWLHICNRINDIKIHQHRKIIHCIILKSSHSKDKNNLNMHCINSIRHQNLRIVKLIMKNCNKISHRSLTRQTRMKQWRKFDYTLTGQEQPQHAS